MSELSNLRAIRQIIVDIDGVLWHGHQELPGVAEFFRFLRSKDIRFVVATNNSARPALEIVERLARLGTKVEEDEVLTSAQATAMYLSHLAPGSRVYLIGGEGIADALTQSGFSLVDHDADVVVVGIDFALTYDKLKRATLEIRRGARFLGTNSDRTFPGEEGLIPGAGAILAALQAATDVAPTVIGKPERAMFDLAVEKLGGARESTAMLGDRLDTDVEGAQRAGLKTILVLTGVTSARALAQSAVRPDWVFRDLVQVREAWRTY